MTDVVGLVLVVVVVVVAMWGALRLRSRRAVRERLFGGLEEEPRPPRLSGRRRLGRALPLIVVLVSGISATLVVFYVIGWGAAFAIAFGLLAGVVSILVLSFFLGHWSLKIQTQLADAIDLMVASLQAGAGLMDALQSAQEESRAPYRRTLENLLVRVRVGEDPVEVCRSMAMSTEIESFRLFYSTLAVQWQSGGSVAPVLSDVGRFVRDHLEMLRRVRGEMAEVRLSVLGVLALTYLLGLVIWRAHPARLEGFLSLRLGQALAAGALALQALGAYWIYRLSRIRY